MRLQGRISEWMDDKGYGFVEPNGGGSRLFLHISSFVDRQRRPVVGDLVTYEASADNNGRPQAKGARFVSNRIEERHSKQFGFFGVVGGALLLAFVGYVAYVRLTHPNSTVQASVYKIFLAREALRVNPQFQCEASMSSCSHMKSCAEAFFHQERCGIAVMDGDGDGIPCEQQWCK